MINISDRDTTSSNQFLAFTNKNDGISVTKTREIFEKLGLRQSNDNIPKQVITTLNVHSIKNVVIDSKRQNNISSNSKNSKNENVSVIIADIKGIKGWKLSNESEKFVVKFFGGATTKDMESYTQPTIERALGNVVQMT